MKYGTITRRRAVILAAILLLAALLLGGCRFQVVEMDEVLIQVPTEAPAQ